MKKMFWGASTILLALAVVVISCSSPEQKSDRESDATVPVIPVDECLTFAGEQLFKSVDNIYQFKFKKSNTELFSKINNQFPRYIKEDGTWETTDSHAWSSGFFAGCLWFMYEYSSDETWKEHAIKWTASMEQEKYNKDNHNNGFMMLSSFGNGYRLTGDEHYKEVLIESARSLASRYSDKVGMIKSNDMEQWSYPVLIDNLVNLELLFWASKNGGDPLWAEMAENHAFNTMLIHVREDGSTAQIADFDPATGEVIRFDTLCGLSASSAWSRGQGQAIYGFIMAYRETNNPKMLETAMRVADYFIDNLPDDYIPYWDFKDPDIPNTIRDSSAASIAAVGLLELQTLIEDEEAKEKYFSAAINILKTLCSPEYLAKGSNSNGIITHATWKKPTDPQADTSLIWGDYNFLEALMKYKKEI